MYKLYIWFFTVFIIVILFCYAIARRMSYMLNMHNMWAYFIFSFTIISLWFIYAVFIYKSKRLGLTRYEEKYREQSEINLFHRLKISLAIFFLLAGLIWMSWGIVGCSAYLSSREPYFELFTIDSLQPAGRKGWNVALAATKNKNKYSLTLPNLYMNTSFPWKEGDLICAKGRTSIFGAIIEDFNAVQCKLDGFRLNQQ